MSSTSLLISSTTKDIYKKLLCLSKQRSHQIMRRRLLFSSHTQNETSTQTSDSAFCYCSLCQNRLGMYGIFSHLKLTRSVQVQFRKKHCTWRKQNQFFLDARSWSQGIYSGGRRKLTNQPLHVWSCRQIFRLQLANCCNSHTFCTWMYISTGVMMWGLG